MEKSESKLSDDQRLAYADEAKRLLADPLFNGLLNSILRDLMVDMIEAQPLSEAATKAHCGMIGLEDIKKRLTLLVNDGAVLRNSMGKQQQE